MMQLGPFTNYWMPFLPGVVLLALFGPGLILHHTQSFWRKRKARRYVPRHGKAARNALDAPRPVSTHLQPGGRAWKIDATREEVAQADGPGRPDAPLLDQMGPVEDEAETTVILRPVFT